MRVNMFFNKRRKEIEKYQQEQIDAESYFGAPEHLIPKLKEIDSQIMTIAHIIRVCSKSGIDCEDKRLELERLRQQRNNLK